jgi:hypothetical protein
VPSFEDWRHAVQFTPGGMAYRSGEILVREAVVDVAFNALEERGKDAPLEGEELRGGWVRISGVPETLEALGLLWSAGVSAQPNHALFASACCPPHPSTLPPGADPFLAHPFLAHPFLAHPFLAHPFLAHPFLAHPFLAQGGGCCCCAGGGGGLAAKPFLAHPNPAAVPKMQATGALRSSARPAPAPPGAGKAGSASKPGVRIAILDTGYAESFVPSGLPGIKVDPHGGDSPDEDKDHYLDPVAGHGTFIAGVIEQLAPGCELEVHEVLSTYGHGYEADIGDELLAFAARPKGEQPQIVNLSFGGYTVVGMQYLADAVAKVQQEGILVVASAGNEASCLPTFPAALPDVIGVGALDADGWPAEYTNFGPWVRACTRGTDVVSLFFEGFNGAEPVAAGEDIDDFHGWARWSGTSFSTPRVVAALALELEKGVAAADAVYNLVDDPQVERKPALGAVVLP